jgi:competence protein ComFC
MVIAPRLTRWTRSAVTHLGDILRGVGELVFPPACLACDADTDGRDTLCDACHKDLLELAALPYCPRCGSSIGPNVPIREDGCAGCPSVLPRFARVHRLGPYRRPIRPGVLRLKYHRDGVIARRLALLLAEGIRRRRSADAGELDLVLPVPMHYGRQFVRGGDHSQRLAAILTRRLGVPLGDDLIRVKDTPPQVHLPRTRRIENVRDAFAVRRGGDVSGAAVLLVDDVTTTGATANEATRALLRAGARRVELAVLAKAEPPSAYGAFMRAPGEA